MTPDQLAGKGTVIAAALGYMDIVYLPELKTNFSEEWFAKNHAALKKRCATLFYQGGVAKGQGTIVVDAEGKQYEVKSMDDLIRVWKHGQISHCFDMNPEAYAKIKDQLVLHPVPELAAA